MSHCTVPFCCLFVFVVRWFLLLNSPSLLVPFFYYRYPFICFLGVPPAPLHAPALFIVVTWRSKFVRQFGHGHGRVVGRRTGKPGFDSALARPHARLY
jgi:hypothetical protein